MTMMTMMTMMWRSEICGVIDVIFIHKVRVIDHVIELGDIKLRDDTKIFIINRWPDEVGRTASAFTRYTYDEDTRNIYEEVGTALSDEIHIPLTEGHVWIMFDGADLKIEDDHIANNLESERQISKRDGVLHRPKYKWDQQGEEVTAVHGGIRVKKAPGELKQ